MLLITLYTVIQSHVRLFIVKYPQDNVL